MDEQTKALEMGTLNPSAKKEEAEEGPSFPELPPKGSSWRIYLQPFWWSTLLAKNRLVYGLNLTVWYLAQFIGAVACINLYSDGDRLMPCALTGTLANPDEASKVYDFPLVMVAIYHIVEWLRTTLLLTVSCIGINWSIGWYATMFNTLYGIVAYAILHMAYFSDDGKACKDVQEYRSAWILAEIIAFWVLFFVYSFPFMFSVCGGKDRAHATLEKAREEALAGDDEDED